MKNEKHWRGGNAKVVSGKSTDLTADGEGGLKLGGAQNTIYHLHLTSETLNQLRTIKDT